MAALPEVTAKLDADVSGFISAWEKAAAAAAAAAAKINAAMATIKDIKVDIDVDNLKGVSAELGKIGTAADKASKGLGGLGESGRKAGAGLGGLGDSSRSVGEGLGGLGQKASGAGDGVAKVGQSAAKSAPMLRALAVVIGLVASILPAIAAAALASGAALQGLGVAGMVVAGGWRGIEQAGERLKASLAGLQKQLESTFRAGLSQEMNKLGKAISTLDGPLKGIAQSIVGVVKEFTGWIRSAAGLNEIRTMLGGVENMVKSLGPGAKAAAQAFTGFGSAAAPAMDEIGKALSSVFENLNQVIQKAKETGQLEKAFQNGAKAVEALGKVLAVVIDIIIEIAAEAGGDAASSIDSFAETLNNAKPIIVEFFKHLSGTVSVIMKIIEVGSKLVTGVAAVGAGFKKAADLVIAFSKALSTGDWSEFVQKLKEIGVVVGPALDKAWQAVKDWAAKTVDEIKKGAEKAVQQAKDWWKKTGDEIKKGVAEAVQAVKDWAKKLPDDLKQGIDKAVQQVKDWWKKTGDEIKKGVDKAVQAVKDWAKKLPDEIKKGVDKAVQAVKDWAKKTVDEIKKGADEVIQKVIDWWDGMVEEVNKGVDKVVAAIKELPQKAVDALNPWKDDMEQAGKDAGDGLNSGLESAVGKLVATATSIAKAAMNAIKKTLGIASPSKVFRDEVGAMIPAGIADGIIANAGLVTDAMRRSGLGNVKSIMGSTSLGGVNIARNSSNQQTFNLRITGGSDTAVGTMIQRLAQQGKLKISANAVVRR